MTYKGQVYKVFSKTTVAVLLALFGTMWWAGAHAASESGTPVRLDVFAMAVGLAGGLALFLFGMEQMAGALKTLAGEGLKGILARLTTNRVTGMLTGALVTAIIQSSSVTTVLTVGFVTAGILSLTQAVGIIFGANIGTTLTAQIIAFKITAYALLMVAAGFGMMFTVKKESVKQYGAMLMGLGLIFLGMDLMSEAMKPLRSYGPFLDLLARMENPFLGILVAAAFTALVQSSSATTGIVIVLASQGVITLPAGIALILGSNIGTCITALLASLGKPLEARRTGMVHILFNVFGVALWVGLVSYLARIVIWMSPEAAGLSGMEKLAAEMPRQVANAHTVFNVANTLIFLPFTSMFARLAVRLVPEKEAVEVSEREAEVTLAAQHLDPALLVVPSVALGQARLEISHMASVIRQVLADYLQAFRENDLAAAEDILSRDELVDELDGQITDYLVKIGHADLNGAQAEEQVRLLHVTNELEHIGDVLEKNMVPLLHKKAETGILFSDAAREELSDFHRRVLESYELAIRCFAEENAELARAATAVTAELIALEQRLRQAHYGRLRGDVQDAMERNQVYVDLVDYLRRVQSYVDSIARTQMRDAEALAA